MANERSPKRDPSEPMVYQIRVTGHLGSEWTDWFDGLSITLEDNGETLLSGPVEVAVLTDLSTDWVWSEAHFPFGQ